MRDCDIEFGPDHEHDDEECSRQIAAMNALDDYYYERCAYNREAEEHMLGRPLFPNEY